jgi:hypothetical protein
MRNQFDTRLIPGLHNSKRSCDSNKGIPLQKLLGGIDRASTVIRHLLLLNIRKKF